MGRVTLHVLKNTALVFKSSSAALISVPCPVCPPFPRVWSYQGDSCASPPQIGLAARVMGILDHSAMSVGHLSFPWSPTSVWGTQNWDIHIAYIEWCKAIVCLQPLEMFNLLVLAFLWSSSLFQWMWLYSHPCDKSWTCKVWRQLENCVPAKQVGHTMVGSTCRKT